MSDYVLIVILIGGLSFITAKCISLAIAGEVYGWLLGTVGVFGLSVYLFEQAPKMNLASILALVGGIIFSLNR